MFNKEDIGAFLTLFFVWFITIVILLSPFVFMAWVISKVFA